ncbi:MAG TPA: serine/threonine-protein kinase [Burkholderiales bacterium]|nr:serine/threonine-protein kinase [Burkholderiales bacterium]
MAEAPTYRNALPLNSMLCEYRLESVLGAGGFGLTYLGWDTKLEKHVAIKEYLPDELAIRALDHSVVPVNTENEVNYKWGLDRFIQEARTLAKFSHPNIARVNRFLEANNTSYMVMDYEAGESLHQCLRRRQTLGEAALKNILMPILDGLEAVHKIGFLHRDIKPSNVFIRESGIPVLLDFGSARVAAVEISKSMTAIVSPGYAPLEQYSNDGNQGPWSDIYALSCVMYRAIAGINPPNAIQRMKSDMVPAALNEARTSYSERFVKAIEWGMKLDERIRPQSVAEWRDLFLDRAPVTALSHGPSNAASHSSATAQMTVAAEERAAATPLRASRTVPPRSSADTRELPGKAKWLLVGAIVLIVLGVLALAAAAFIRQQAPEPAAIQPHPAAQGATAGGGNVEKPQLH